MPGTNHDHPTTSSASSAISNAVVRLMSDYTGRGATKAHTYLNDDLITVVLQDNLTKGEQSLVRDGRSELVLTARRAYQDTMRTDLVSAVETHSGRTVTAFLSANHIDPDIAVESFILAPPPD